MGGHRGSNGRVELQSEEHPLPGKTGPDTWAHGPWPLGLIVLLSSRALGLMGSLAHGHIASCALRLLGSSLR